MGFYFKKFFHHLKNRTLFLVIKRTLYVKKHLKKENFDEKEYLVGLGIKTLGYRMDLDNPKSFNEKINWLKLNYIDEKMKYVVDKINAKEYLKSLGLNKYVIPTIKVYDKFQNINLDELPQKFVIKNTQDSGGVFVCKDKSLITINDISKKLKNKAGFISANGRTWSLEPVYGVDSNKVIVEELLNTPDGHAPWDYKFFCFNGEPKFLYVATNRDRNVCFDFFDIDFNHLKVKQCHPNSNAIIKKPRNYDTMLNVCRALSKNFPEVRVDLYNINGNIYFSELTFYSNAGLLPFKPKKWDRIFGDMWDLSKIDEFR